MIRVKQTSQLTFLQVVLQTQEDIIYTLLMYFSRSLSLCGQKHLFETTEAEIELILSYRIVINGNKLYGYRIVQQLEPC